MKKLIIFTISFAMVFAMGFAMVGVAIYFPQYYWTETKSTLTILGIGFPELVADKTVEEKMLISNFMRECTEKGYRMFWAMDAYNKVPMLACDK